MPDEVLTNGASTVVSSSKTVSEIWGRFSAAVRKIPDSEFKPDDEQIALFRSAYETLPSKLLALSEHKDPRVSAPFLLLCRFISDEFPDPALLAIGEARYTRSHNNLLLSAAKQVDALSDFDGLQQIANEFYSTAEMHFKNAEFTSGMGRMQNAAMHFRNGFLGLVEFADLVAVALKDKN